MLPGMSGYAVCNKLKKSKKLKAIVVRGTRDVNVAEPQEFVEMCARISGVKGRHVRERTRQALDKVGVLYAADRAVKTRAS